VRPSLFRGNAILRLPHKRKETQPRCRACAATRAAQHIPDPWTRLGWLSIVLATDPNQIGLCSVGGFAPCSGHPLVKGSLRVVPA
jgi:hypothetical protein